MKKRMLISMMCVVCIFSLLCIGATSRAADVTDGAPIVINGVMIEDTSVICNNKYYLPARTVFEKIGALVFYRSSDRKILVLSRDGDVIEHVIGMGALYINGEQKIFLNASISVNGVTYLPIDMMSTAFRTNAVSYSNQQIKIHKPISNTTYGKAVNDAMYASTYGNFHPEKFKRYINYHVNKPELSMQNVVFMVNLGLDFPFYQNVTVIANPYDPLVLVNKYNQLPFAFAQKNLVSMDKNYTVNDGKVYLMEQTAYANFVRMADAARKEGISIKSVSSYRTEDYQRRLYNKKIKTLGTNNADNYSARAGFSEHQTGLAVDINTTKNSFVNTPTFQWLQKHAHEYGYILRYPKGQKWITGYEFEPWHYRYVGVEAATVIHREGITYEQYYAKYIDVNEFR